MCTKKWNICRSPIPLGWLHGGRLRGHDGVPAVLDVQEQDEAPAPRRSAVTEGGRGVPLPDRTQPRGKHCDRWCVNTAQARRFLGVDVLEAWFTMRKTLIYWVGGHLFRKFCNIFSKSSTCLLGQHGSCSTAQWPGNSQKTVNKTFGTSGRPTQ